MKIIVRYYEFQEREFRSKKQLSLFLKKHTDNEILMALEVKDKLTYALELKRFLENYKYSYQKGK